MNPQSVICFYLTIAYAINLESKIKTDNGAFYELPFLATPAESERE